MKVECLLWTKIKHFKEKKIYLIVKNITLQGSKFNYNKKLISKMKIFFSKKLNQIPEKRRFKYHWIKLWYRIRNIKWRIISYQKSNSAQKIAW